MSRSRNLTGSVLHSALENAAHAYGYDRETFRRYLQYAVLVDCFSDELGDVELVVLKTARKQLVDLQDGVDWTFTAMNQLALPVDR